MVRLIDADALIDKYQSEFSIDVFRYEILEDLNEAPTVEAVPVKHGHWTVHEEPLWYENTTAPFYRCECGYDTRYDTPYCPMCGAKMDEVE